MVPADGFEPPTLCSEDRCSIQLSYAGTSTAIIPELPLILDCVALSGMLSL